MARTCSLEGCGKPYHARGWCYGHYMRQYRCGDPVLTKRAQQAASRPQTCAVSGCARAPKTLALCPMHYKRMWRHGDPLVKKVDGTQGCHVVGCPRKHRTKGYCAAHWRRMTMTPEAYQAFVQAARRRYYQRHRARILAQTQAYRRRHLAAVRAWWQVHYQAHGEAYRLRARTWYQEHRDQALVQRRRWRVQHPERKRHHDRTRKARVRGATQADLTRHEWAAIKAAFGYRCAYCGVRPRRLTQDHITPVAKGGAHTLQNVVPACALCNSRKSTGRPPRPVQPLLFVV